MYKNIANKIKGFAATMGWLELITGVILWIYFLSDHEPVFAWSSLGGGIVMLFFSWILYGFGQLVGDTEEIKNKMNAQGTKKEDSLPEL